MYRYGRILTAAAFAAWGIVGCLPSEPPPSEETGSALPPPQPMDSAELLAEWREHAQVYDVKPSPENFAETTAAMTGAVTAAAQLAFTGSNAMAPLIQTLADPEAGPRKKVLVVQSAAQHMNAGYIPLLTPLVSNPHDATTRACAVALLGFIVDPAVSPALRKATDDPDRRVWFSALLGLARNGDVPAHQRLIEMYSAEGTADSEKEQIVDALILHPENGGLKELAAALLDPGTFAPIQIRIAEALGRAGDNTVLDALRETRESSANPSVKEIVESAIAAIEERSGAAASGE